MWWAIVTIMHWIKSSIYYLYKYFLFFFTTFTVELLFISFHFIFMSRRSFETSKNFQYTHAQIIYTVRIKKNNNSSPSVQDLIRRQKYMQTINAKQHSFTLFLLEFHWSRKKTIYAFIRRIHCLELSFFYEKSTKIGWFFNFCIFTKSGQTTQIRWVFSHLKQFPSISLNLTFKWNCNYQLNNWSSHIRTILIIQVNKKRNQNE